MATQSTTANAAVCPGDDVFVGGKLCYCTKVSNDLRFNLYEVVDVDTGETMVKARHELTVPSISVMAPPVQADPVIADDIPGNDEKPPDAKKKRFVDVSEEDLDSYALNKNSKHTRNQTLWGVAIFKGKYTVAIFGQNVRVVKHVVTERSQSADFAKSPPS